MTRLSCLLLAAAGVMLARRNARESECRFERRIWIALILSAAFGGLAAIMGWRFVSGLAEGRSYAFTLLRDYTAASAAIRWYHVVLPIDAVSAINEFDLQLTIRQVGWLFRGTITRSRALRAARDASVHQPEASDE